MKKPITKEEIKSNMLQSLNDFMKDFGIDEISFGKTHKIKKTTGVHADDVIITKTK